MRTTPRTLKELYRRATTYEVAAYLPDGRVLRLGFLRNVTKLALLEAARSRADDLLPFLNEQDTFSYSTRDGMKLGPITVRETGRTERECAAEEG